MIVLRSTNMQCPLYKVTCDVCLSPEATAVAQKCRGKTYIHSILKLFLYCLSITKHEKADCLAHMIISPFSTYKELVLV